MSAMMRAALVQSFSAPLGLTELPVQQPAAGQVLVRLAATGVCHTDLHASRGDWPVRPSLPFVPGHEGVGHVAAVGEGVRRLREGDRVGVPWLHSACGFCPHCRTGWETLCGAQTNTGYSVNGTFADFVLADAGFVAPLPDGLDWGPAAPVLCAGVTVYKGLKETEARPGQWVVVSGIGGLGHMAVQYAQAMGMHVAAVDVHPAKLALARELGAEAVLDPADGDAAATLLRTMGGGAHAALVTAVSPAAIETVFGLLGAHGTMALVGLPPGRFCLPIFETVLKRITVRGSIVGTRQDLDEALAFAADGKVAARFTWARLDEINDVFRRLEEGSVDGRVVLNLS